MIYYLLRLIAILVLYSVFRLEARGTKEIPESGPLIIAANHKSWLDPVAIGVAVTRRVHFMAKEELFHIPLFVSLIKALYAFPVKREVADLRALKTAIKILRSNEVLGIFVEGTRVKAEGIGEIKPGIYTLAKISGAPVVLCAIKGTRQLFIRRLPPVPAKIKLVFKRFEADASVLSEKEYLAILKKTLEGMYNEA
jgi:1-acyl-sn-glycerol-3-phosphate acyltransferase